MDVTAVLPSGDLLHLRAKKTDTVRRLKHDIETQSRIPKPEQWIEYRSDEASYLLDHLSLSSQVPDGAYIHVHRREDEKIHLNIKTLNGKTLAFIVDNYHTIGDVIDTINESEDSPSDTCTDLIHDGKRLESDWTLADYNVPTEATMYCVVTLKTVTEVRESGNYTVVQPRLQPTGEFGNEYEYIYVAGWPKVSYKWPYIGEYKDRLAAFHGKDYDEASFGRHSRYGDAFDVNVLLPGGRRIVMAIKDKHSIGSLKSVIQHEGIAASDQILEYNGVVLRDEHHVAEYGIVPNGTIVVSSRHAKPTQVGMKVIIDSVSVELGVDKTHTVGEVKAMIGQKTGKDVHNKYLVADNGVRLEDNRTLMDYGIESNDRLALAGSTGLRTFHTRSFHHPRTLLKEAPDTLLHRSSKTLEVRSTDHGFSVPWPSSVQRLKEMINEEVEEISADDILVTLLKGDETELDDDALEALRREPDPVVHFRLKTEEPDHTVNCSIQ